MGDAEPEGGSGRQDPGTTIYKSKFKIAPQIYSGKKNIFTQIPLKDRAKSSWNNNINKTLAKLWGRGGTSERLPLVSMMASELPPFICSPNIYRAPNRC